MQRWIKRTYAVFIGMFVLLTAATLWGLPFVLGHTSLIYWTYRGKTRLTESNYEEAGEFGGMGKPP